LHEGKGPQTCKAFILKFLPLQLTYHGIQCSTLSDYDSDDDYDSNEEFEDQYASSAHDTPAELLGGMLEQRNPEAEKLGEKHKDMKDTEMIIPKTR
jgi:hypothetical protein